MKAEFLVDRTTVNFDVDMSGLVEPPRILNISAKKCPMSPTLLYDLAYERTDTTREVAIYRMLGSRSPAMAHLFQP